MYRRILLLIVSVVWLLGFQPNQTTAQSLSCSAFDAWVWAQSVYEQSNAADRAAIDPDANGVACDQLRGIEGFSPALWTTSIPANVDTGQLVRIVDGDSLHILINGVDEEVRLYRADTPEFDPLECGAQEATNALTALLGYNDQGTTVYIEHDKTIRDKYDRLLAYLWLMIDGQPYLVNEALVRSGWAEDKDYGDRIYAGQMGEAAQFAKQYGVGAFGVCGALGPATGSPKTSQAPIPTQAPARPAPTVVPNPGDCESSYPEFCLAPAWVIGDLDCGDIPYSHFTVYPPDSHGFDGNQDGEGCEGPR